ncbi:MAG: type II toxin-antitoxin system VapC family toxin [Caldilineaceae bacterium]
MTDTPSVTPHYILDACALIAFLGREPGAAVVDGLLADPNNICLAHAINICEVYYDLVRQSGTATARQAVADLVAVGVQVRQDMDTEFWQQAGDLKVSPGKLSLADCFALALAMKSGATLVTSDHHEFDPIVPLGLCPILFIR